MAETSRSQVTITLGRSGQVATRQVASTEMVALSYVQKLSVQTLQTISLKLNNTYWNLSQRSCSGAGGLNKTTDNTKNFNNVTCDCTFNSSSVCHVTRIDARKPALGEWTARAQL